MLQRLLFVVDRDDEKPRAFRARGAQEIEPRRVAVVGFDAEAAERFHLLGIVIEDGRAEAVRAQQARDDVSEAADAREDHRMIALVDLVRFALR